MPSRIDIGPEGGPFVAINENSNDLELQDINGNVIAKWDETVGAWDLNANSLTNIDAIDAASVGADDLNISGVSNNTTTSVIDALNADGEGHNVLTQRTEDVSTSGKTILSQTTDSFGAFVIVYGTVTGESTEFIDLILRTRSSTNAVFANINTSGPASRTYAAPGGDVELAMSSGTYQIVASSILLEL